MPDKHLSSRFDADLTLLSTRLLEMGGLVESQIAHAIEALHTSDLDLVERVLEGERRLNVMEMEIDEEISNVIARRQPRACGRRGTQDCEANPSNCAGFERAGHQHC
jgi:phosphate transport system protein